MDTAFLNKANVKKLVHQNGKRWSKEAESALNYAVMGIVLRAIATSGGHKTITEAEVIHAVATYGSR